MEENKIIRETMIEDDVKMVEYSDGTHVFIPLEKDNEGHDVKCQKTNFFQRIFKWYDDLKIKPYVRGRDLNNTKENPGENKPVSSMEAGIQIKF